MIERKVMVSGKLMLPRWSASIGRFGCDDGSTSDNPSNTHTDFSFGDASVWHLHAGPPDQTWNAGMKVMLLNDTSLSRHVGSLAISAALERLISPAGPKLLSESA
jgi:hypothetical protein